MKNSLGKYSQLYNYLTEAVKTFILEVTKHRLCDMATEEWTVKDELCHIAYWHNYYAQNYSSMADGFEPFVFKSKGGSTRNQDGVNKYRRKSRKNLIAILNSAQSSLYTTIVIKEIPKMTYIEGREYRTEDFLVMITGHIQRHTMQVKRARRF